MQKSASGNCPHSPSGYPWFLPQPRGFGRRFGDAIVPEWAGGNLVILGEQYGLNFSREERTERPAQLLNQTEESSGLGWRSSNGRVGLCMVFQRRRGLKDRGELFISRISFQQQLEGGYLWPMLGQRAGSRVRLWVRSRPEDTKYKPYTKGC